MRSWREPNTPISQPRGAGATRSWQESYRNGRCSAEHQVVHIARVRRFEAAQGIAAEILLTTSTKAYLVNQPAWSVTKAQTLIPRPLATRDDLTCGTLKFKYVWVDLASAYLTPHG